MLGFLNDDKFPTRRINKNCLLLSEKLLWCSLIHNSHCSIVLFEEWSVVKWGTLQLTTACQGWDNGVDDDTISTSLSLIRSLALCGVHWIVERKVFGGRLIGSTGHHRIFISHASLDRPLRSDTTHDSNHPKINNFFLLFLSRPLADVIT